MNRTFDTFREAGQYATRFCLENNTTASVVRIDGRWAVVPSDEFQAKEEEDRKLADQRRKAEEQAFVEARLRAEEEEAHLQKRKEYYRQLSADALKALWENRELLSIEPRELEIVRCILREQLGIKRPSAVNLVVCPQCHMVGDACTCGRSWY